jgi:hypothetical protein
MANEREILGLHREKSLLVRVTKIFSRLREGGMYEGEDKCIRGFGVDTRKKDTILKT